MSDDITVLNDSISMLSGPMDVEGEPQVDHKVLVKSHEDSSMNGLWWVREGQWERVSPLAHVSTGDLLAELASREALTVPTWDSRFDAPEWARGSMVIDVSDGRTAMVDDVERVASVLSSAPLHVRFRPSFALGAHREVRVFIGPDRDHLALAGKITVGVDEAPDLMRCSVDVVFDSPELEDDPG